MIPGRSVRFVASSPLHRWDPRWRLVTLLVLVFAASAVQRLEWLPVLVVMVAAIVIWSRVDPLDVLRRLRYPSLLILAMVVFLPFAAEGETLWSLGLLTVTAEGLSAAFLVSTRFLAILILAVVFLGSAPALEQVRAARELGVPDLITDLALLVVRYVEILTTELRQMRIAMRLRGDTARSWRSIRSTIWLLGSLLLRSHERAERVYRAMRLRGYGEDPRRIGGGEPGRGRWVRPADRIIAAAFMAFGLILTMAQWVYPG